MAKSIYVLNGPNLNLLGQRQPDVYGRNTLADVEVLCRRRAQRYELEVTFRQSNHEGDIVDWLQEARHDACGVIINPGACNPSNIALSIADACREIREHENLDTNHVRQDPAIRLMVYL